MTQTPVGGQPPLDPLHGKAGKGRWSSADLGFVLVAAVAVFATRWILWPKYLVDWDAVAFADALREFDVTCNRPHPPGFPIFIVLGRLANYLVHDPTTALSLVSTLASAAAVPLLYSLGRHWLDRRWAALWVIWWASQPLCWYYGPLQLTYPLEAFTTLGLMLVWTRQDEHGGGSGALAGGLFGLALGVRMSTLAVLGLVFLARWLCRDWRWKLASAAAFVTGVAAWMLPAAWCSGGWSAYRTASHYTGEGFFVSESALRGNWAAVGQHARHLGAGLAEVLGPAGLELLLVVWGAVLVLSRRRESIAVRDGALWLGGTLAYLMLFHMGQLGYLIAVLPPLGLLALYPCRVVLRPWEGKVPGWRREGGLAVALVVMLWHGAQFLEADNRASYHAIRKNDYAWERYTAVVRENFDPADTVLFCFGAFRQAAWYLPEYRTCIATLLYRNPEQFPLETQNVHWSQGRVITPEHWFYPAGFQPAPLRLPAGTKHVVVLDAVSWVYGPPPPALFPVGPQGEVQAIDLDGPTELRYEFGRWSLRPAYGDPERIGPAAEEPGLRAGPTHP